MIETDQSSKKQEDRKRKKEALEALKKKQACKGRSENFTEGDHSSETSDSESEYLPPSNSKGSSKPSQHKSENNNGNNNDEEEDGERAFGRMHSWVVMIKPDIYTPELIKKLKDKRNEDLGSFGDVNIDSEIQSPKDQYKFMKAHFEDFVHQKALLAVLLTWKSFNKVIYDRAKCAIHTMMKNMSSFKLRNKTMKHPLQNCTPQQSIVDPDILLTYHKVLQKLSRQNESLRTLFEWKTIVKYTKEMGPSKFCKYVFPILLEVFCLQWAVLPLQWTLLFGSKQIGCRRSDPESLFNDQSKPSKNELKQSELEDPKNDIDILLLPGSSVCSQVQEGNVSTDTVILQEDPNWELIFPSATFQMQIF